MTRRLVRRPPTPSTRLKTTLEAAPRPLLLAGYRRRRPSRRSSRSATRRPTCIIRCTLEDVIVGGGSFRLVRSQLARWIGRLVEGRGPSPPSPSFPPLLGFARSLSLCLGLELISLIPCFPSTTLYILLFPLCERQPVLGSASRARQSGSLTRLPSSSPRLPGGGARVGFRRKTESRMKRPRRHLGPRLASKRAYRHDPASKERA